jgi:hypothetical protein
MIFSPCQLRGGKGEVWQICEPMNHPLTVRNIPPETRFRAEQLKHSQAML